ncbi:Mitochondrial carrier protein [Moelleriella libera RCEF 2490]|uniref:Mitochondrial carrier protein n=1 Tax=Moelleriella libera RCEF 2490 TaxID=1081109 RepID=A0A166NZ31_9HYPO|nr:Mitochondrial carrier protein [Moelleriella libera RCEF 2490]
MATDFWAGYISGAVGILIGNPFDIMKVRLQAGESITSNANRRGAAALAAGTAAPVLGYGALNALLFATYNRSESVIRKLLTHDPSLLSTWLAGALGGLATWVVSAPTELIKCRAQMSTSREASWQIARGIWGSQGLRGFYVGGTVTVLRDSIGYGFYFWSYELANGIWSQIIQNERRSLLQEASQTLICGGLAGVVTWASVFPLDTIKTRIQTHRLVEQCASGPLLQSSAAADYQTIRRPRASEIAQAMYRERGLGVFFHGLTICSIRAFIVNATQWAVYEWIMREFSRGSRGKVR